MIVIDYRDKRPLYEQVAEKLSQLIICGALESNAKLPSVRSLALDLSINPNTIQRAYMQLEQDGYIYTIVGRGNYVTDRTEWQKGYQVAARQELSESLAKAKSSGLTLEDVLSMARQCYAGEAGTPPGDGAAASGYAGAGNGIAAASGNAAIQGNVPMENASTTSKEEPTE
ncbi:MAG: GntR family transcriptional regulator [Lachnospiraceae bacterium]|nr:GntR family transcriptional regulator [Lachnospiraceae bacterium]